MEDLLLMLSVDDFFALLALFAGCFTSLYYLKRRVPTTKLALDWQQSDTYQPPINPCMIETYPMAARQPMRSRLFRRMQHSDSDADTYGYRFLAISA
ncbi:hypothetical protein [uncultured Brevibacillus sp.]|uniref:hypothetical protein n=1 Tax=uncultured Brevibacillus sp. TaxID=169970 RepID=UPI00259AC54A|nr:hypothetical protein [uncultured Brevibacillus sp.]